MKILVTGGAGFIGSHVTDAYLAQGHEVVIIDNLWSGRRDFINPRARFYEADITDLDMLKSIFVHEKIDFVNHHAAQVDVRVSVWDPLFDARVNVIGLLNVLEACHEFSVRRIIFVSSGGVLYGESEVIPSPEQTAKKPISPYGVAKFASESYLLSYKHTHGLEYITLRYANVYGPRQTPKSEATVISTFTNQLVSNSAVTIFGDGHQTRDFVFVEDVVKANLLATAKLSELNHRPAHSLDDLALNIGTGCETSINEIFARLSHALDVHGDACYAAPRVGEIQRSALDIAKARYLLGFEPKVSLDEGLPASVQWVRTMADSRAGSS